MVAHGLLDNCVEIWEPAQRINIVYVNISIPELVGELLRFVRM